MGINKNGVTINMSQEIKTFKGHHGTTSVKCKCIRKNNFIKSTGGWLGPGVYFFHDDKDLARSWASRNSRFNQAKVEVLECLISVPIESVLDIVDPKSEQSKKVNALRENFLKSALSRDRLIKIDDRMLDGKILNMICELNKYSIIRNSTHTLTEQDRKSGIEFSHICNGVELCVRDLDMINVV